MLKLAIELSRPSRMFSINTVLPTPVCPTTRILLLSFFNRLMIKYQFHKVSIVGT